MFSNQLCNSAFILDRINFDLDLAIISSAELPKIQLNDAAIRNQKLMLGSTLTTKLSSMRYSIDAS